MTAFEGVREHPDGAGEVICDRCGHPRLAHWVPGKSTTACVVCLDGHTLTTDLGSGRVGICTIRADALPAVRVVAAPTESEER